jgi:hypothetical protein
MNKRSAIVVALGLIAALVIGGAGFTMGMTGPAPSLASVRQPAPKVRTLHRTVTVHRPGSAAQVTNVAAPASATMSGGPEDGDGEGWDDDGGWDEHEGEDHGSDQEDHEGSHGEGGDD